MDGSLLKENWRRPWKGYVAGRRGLLPDGTIPAARLLHSKEVSFSNSCLLLETVGSPRGARGKAGGSGPWTWEVVGWAGSSRKRRDSCLLSLGLQTVSRGAQTPTLLPDAPNTPERVPEFSRRAGAGLAQATPTKGLFKVPTLSWPRLPDSQRAPFESASLALLAVLAPAWDSSE